MDIDLISPESSLPNLLQTENDVFHTTDDIDDNFTSKELIAVKIIKCFQSVKRNSKTSVTLSSSLLPLFQEYYKEWNILENPNLGFDLLYKWKTFSETSKMRSEKEGFELFLWKDWIPHVQNGVSLWNPLYPKVLLDFINHWSCLIEPWMLDNLLNHHILTRLETEIEKCKTSPNDIPLHTWIHPWFPIFKNEMKSLHLSILQALKISLKDWQPCEPSAKLMLDPWKKVISKKALEKFVAKNIYPKLCFHMYNSNINLKELDAINYIFTWEHYISHKYLLNIFKDNFFPRWLQALCVWLTQYPSFEVVVEWFVFWQQLFMSRFNKNVIVNEYLVRALDYISQATFLPQPDLYINEQNSLPAISKIGQNNLKSTNCASTSSTLTFKEILEQKAQEANINIIPLKSYFNESRQLYQFGKCVIYLEKGVIYTKNYNKCWVPISLQDLLSSSV